MNVSEISNVNNFQGQGSSTASVTSAPKTVQPVEKPEKIEKASVNSPDIKDNKDINSKENDDNKAGVASSSAIKEAVSKINSKTNSCEAVYGIHEGTNRVTIKMVDKKTKETVKEFPAEETLDLIAKAWELAGIMVDERR